VIPGDETIRLEHGSGGELSRALVEEVIHPALRSAAYPELLDATTVDLAGPIALTTDTYVVDPPFFPGGDIGRLAVFGSCNDLAVSGAQPRFLTVGLVLEEGFPVADLRRAMRSPPPGGKRWQGGMSPNADGSSQCEGRHMAASALPPGARDR